MRMPLSSIFVKRFRGREGNLYVAALVALVLGALVAVLAHIAVPDHGPEEYCPICNGFHLPCIVSAVLLLIYLAVGYSDYALRVCLAFFFLLPPQSRSPPLE